MRTTGVKHIQMAFTMFYSVNNVLDLCGQQTAKNRSIQISTTMEVELNTADKRIAHDVLQPMVVIALMSMLKMSCIHGCIRAVDASATLSQIANIVNSIPCPLLKLPNLDKVAIIRPFPQSPSTMKQHVRPSKA